MAISRNKWRGEVNRLAVREAWQNNTPQEPIIEPELASTRSGFVTRIMGVVATFETRPRKRCHPALSLRR